MADDVIAHQAKQVTHLLFDSLYWCDLLTGEWGESLDDPDEDWAPIIAGAVAKVEAFLRHGTVPDFEAEYMGE